MNQNVIAELDAFVASRRAAGRTEPEAVEDAFELASSWYETPAEGGRLLTDAEMNAVTDWLDTQAQTVFQVEDFETYCGELGMYGRNTLREGDAN